MHLHCIVDQQLILGVQRHLQRMCENVSLRLLFYYYLTLIWKLAAPQERTDWIWIFAEILHCRADVCHWI